MYVHLDFWTYLNYETRSEAKQPKQALCYGLCPNLFRFQFRLIRIETSFFEKNLLVHSMYNSCPQCVLCNLKHPHSCHPKFFYTFAQKYVVLSIGNTHWETTRNSREKYRECINLKAQIYSNVYCRIPVRHFFSQSRRLLTKNLKV
jgi:hypothetical protein